MEATERIVIDAVQAHFLHEVQVADTIRACTASCGIVPNTSAA